MSSTVQIELLQLAAILEGLANKWWEFWNQRECALAAIYADMLTQIARLGRPEDVVDFYKLLASDSTTSLVTLRVIYELQQLFSEDA